MKECTVCLKEHQRTQPTCSRSCAAKTRTYKERECKFPKCSKRFTPTTPSPFCAPTHAILCEECSIPIEVRSEPRFSHLCHDCAIKAGKEKARKTNIDKYGVEHHFANKEIQEKIKQTNLEKFGVENPAQSKEVQEKIAQTNIERYGGIAPIHSDEVKTKWRKTNQERYGHPYAIASKTGKEAIKETNNARYGVDYTLALPEIRERIAQTNIERYGVENVFAASEIKERIAETMLKKLQENNGVIPRISKINQRYAKKLEELFDCNISFEKCFANYNADLSVDNKSLLIDINPTVTHNTHLSFHCLLNACELPCVAHKQIAQDYHYKRALAALQENITLIQKYDWDDDENMLPFIGGKTQSGFIKLSARKLTKAKITSKEANRFLALNHIQGQVRNQTHCYGLKDKNDELLAVATFGKARFGAKADYEWLRYAVKRQHIIHGASNTLWQQFLTDSGASTIVSYVDFNHTTRKEIFLNTLGFQELVPTGPTLVWHNIKTNHRVTQTALLRLGADRLLKTNYGSRKESGLDNKAIMLIEGYLPVYTAGNRVFLYEK